MTLWVARALERASQRALAAPFKTLALAYLPGHGRTKRGRHCTRAGEASLVAPSPVDNSGATVRTEPDALAGVSVHGQAWRKGRRQRFGGPETRTLPT